MTVQRLSPRHLVPAGGGGLDALSAVNHLVDAVGGWIETVQVEETKRAGIDARASVLLARISAERAVVLSYLDQSFDERRDDFRRLFDALDTALLGPTGQVAEILGAITTLALSSPFADLADRDRVLERLRDTETEWVV